MEIERTDWVIDPVIVHGHVGHGIEIVEYSDSPDEYGNLAIQCETCGVVIADIDYGKEAS